MASDIGGDHGPWMRCRHTATQHISVYAANLRVCCYAGRLYAGWSPGVVRSRRLFRVSERERQRANRRLLFSASFWTPSSLAPSSSNLGWLPGFAAMVNRTRNHSHLARLDLGRARRVYAFIRLGEHPRPPPPSIVENSEGRLFSWARTLSLTRAHPAAHPHPHPHPQSQS